MTPICAECSRPITPCRSGATGQPSSFCSRHCVGAYVSRQRRQARAAHEWGYTAAQFPPDTHFEDTTSPPDPPRRLNCPSLFESRRNGASQYTPP